MTDGIDDAHADQEAAEDLVPPEGAGCASTKKDQGLAEPRA